MEQVTRYLDAGTLTAEGSNGVSYAYRRLGPLYPDAAHGFLYQHAGEFAGDVLKFLDSSQI